MAPTTDPRPAPTLADVARVAQVSTATVSRCLNAPAKVSQDTRRRVMEAVDTLGYAPNFGARAMASRRTRTIGAVIPTMENAIFARGLQAFQEELRALGYQLLVASSSYRQDVEEEQIRALVAHGAEGLLLIGHDRDETVYRFLRAQGIPALVTWTVDPDSARPSIGFDNFIAMRALARAVVAQGHRKFAMISGETAGNDRARDRVRGVRAAMVEDGIDPDTLRLIEVPYGIENGARAFAELFAVPDPPTVVMCGNDVLAVGALDQARRMGLDVPEQVSITGFDDIELARIAVPPLTTVHVPHREMGRAAARALVAMVRQDAPPERIVLDADLRLRDSLGPPPRGSGPPRP
mgnify:CR=1 FL=1